MPALIDVLEAPLARGAVAVDIGLGEVAQDHGVGAVAAVVRRSRRVEVVNSGSTQVLSGVDGHVVGPEDLDCEVAGVGGRDGRGDRTSMLRSPNGAVGVQAATGLPSSPVTVTVGAAEAVAGADGGDGEREQEDELRVEDMRRREARSRPPRKGPGRELSRRAYEFVRARTTLNVTPTLGFEPRSPSLQVKCSTS